MTLKTDNAGMFSVGAPPQGGDVVGVLRWCNRLFVFLANFLRRPEFPGVVFSRIDATNLEEFKAEDGMMIYAGPGVLGPQEGFYVHEAGLWKKLAGS
jgi:hypothetical protein